MYERVVNCSKICKYDKKLILLRCNLNKIMIIGILLFSSIVVPFIFYIVMDKIKEYKYRKQFKELKIGDRYGACLNSDEVFEEPKYIYLEITNKKEKDGIYYVQYKFIGNDTKYSTRFDIFLELYFKTDGKNTYN